MQRSRHPYLRQSGPLCHLSIESLDTNNDLVRKRGVPQDGLPLPITGFDDIPFSPDGGDVRGLRKTFDGRRFFR